MLKVVFALLLIVSLNALASTLSINEKRTIEKAHKAYVSINLLKSIEKMCQKQEYFQEDSWIKYKALIKEKMGVSFEKFHDNFLPLDDISSVLNSHLNEVDCSSKTLDDTLFTVYEEADMDLFNLEIAAEFFEPLKTAKEQKELEMKELRGRINEEFEKAYSIVIGAVINTEKVPQEHLQRFLPYGTNAYTYRINKGWKKPFNHYMPADKAHEWNEARYQTEKNKPNDEVSKYLENQSVSKKLNQESLLFITKNRLITIRVPMEEAAYILEQLGKPDWEWKDGSLYENGVIKGGRPIL